MRPIKKKLVKNEWPKKEMFGVSPTTWTRNLFFGGTRKMAIPENPEYKPPLNTRPPWWNQGIFLHKKCFLVHFQCKNTYQSNLFIIPPVIKNFGEYRTNKKTNAFGKSDHEACNWVMMSALVQLHQRAVSLGANAVINVKSNYKNNETSSTTNYTCGAGSLMAGVALIGTFVTLE